jgi:AcrR family transcriptional regulator
MGVRVRLTAAERRTQILRTAAHAFAAAGYTATTTAEIARSAGVSQPHVVRLFGTKQQLFVAVLRSVCDRIEQGFRDAADQDPSLNNLAHCCETFASDRELLLIPLHGFSASAVPAIGEVARERFGRIYRLIRDLTGASPRQAREVLSTAILLAGMTATETRQPTREPIPATESPRDPWRLGYLEPFPVRTGVSG